MQMMHKWSVLPMTMKKHHYLFQDGADLASLLGTLDLWTPVIHCKVDLHDEQHKQHPLAESNVRKPFDIGSSLWEITWFVVHRIACCAVMRTSSFSRWSSDSREDTILTQLAERIPASLALLVSPGVYIEIINVACSWVWWFLVVVSLKACHCRWNPIHQ